MISVSNLNYSYHNSKEIPFRNFTVPGGGQLLLLGDSGSGKTTLLHLLGGLLKPQSGKIVVGGTDITQLPESSMDRFRAKHFGFVFQKNHLITALSVKDNLSMAPFLAGRKPDKGRIDDLLSRLGLSDKRDARTNELSHGQAQRVAIARAVLNKPSVILADEPTSALDDKNCSEVIGLLQGVAIENHSVLVVATHDLRLKSQIREHLQL